jgi:PAS domain S-box-containing protein
VLSDNDKFFITQFGGQLVFIHNNGSLEYVSPALETLLGYSSGELIGKPYADLFGNSDFARIKDKLTARTKVAVLKDSVYLTRKNGQYLWADVEIRDMPAVPTVSVTRQLGVIRDNNRLKQLEDVITLLAFDPAKLTDIAFFESLISHTAVALEVDYAFVTVTKPPYKSVEMLAFWKGDHFATPYAYDLDDTPCDRVIRGGEVTHVQFGVQNYYPKDADLVALNAQSYIGVPIYDRAGYVRGHLALLDKQPLKMTEFRKSLTTIFSRQVSLALESLFPLTSEDKLAAKPA